MSFWRRLTLMTLLTFLLVVTITLWRDVASNSDDDADMPFTPPSDSNF